MYPNHQGKYDLLGIITTHDKVLSFVMDKQKSHTMLVREFVDLVQAKRLEKDNPRQGLPYHTGVIQSKDSFYGEIRPAQMPIADELTAKWKAWKAAGALTSEMETAALMIVAQVLHVRCGAVLNVLWNADNDDAPAIPPDATERGVKAAVEAIRVLIREDSKA